MLLLGCVLTIKEAPPGSTPVASPIRHGFFVESAIWHVEPDTLELTGQ